MRSDGAVSRVKTLQGSPPHQVMPKANQCRLGLKCHINYPLVADSFKNAGLIMLIRLAS